MWEMCQTQTIVDRFFHNYIEIATKDLALVVNNFIKSKFFS